MSSLGISAITLAFVFGGGLLGVLIGARLPKHHQSAETKEAVRLGMGMVGAIVALVLGLLISSAKTYNDMQRDELIQMSANLVILGRLLRHYGPEADAARVSLRLSVGRILVDTWPQEPKEKVEVLPATAKVEDVFDQVLNLAPRDDKQRVIQSQVSSLLVGLGQMRRLIYGQTSTTIARPLLWLMILWLTSIFISWDVFAFQRDYDCFVFRVGVVRIRRHFLDARTVLALWRFAAHLECATACGLHCSWTIAGLSQSPGQQVGKVPDPTSCALLRLPP